MKWLLRRFLPDEVYVVVGPGDDAFEAHTTLQGAVEVEPEGGHVSDAIRLVID